jgi:hypothetical protein
MNKPNRTRAGLARRSLLVLASLALLTITAPAQVPTMISYQGRVLVDNANYNGSGQFKFALVNGAGNVTFWSNDGSSVAGSQPTAAVSLSVANGLVMTLLGDTSLANMTAIPAAVFNNSDVRVRVWFNGGAGFQQLTPDQRIVSVGYAVMASNVPDGAITSAKLANGAVTSGKIANDAIGATQIATGAVNSSDIADGSILGTDIADGSIFGLDIANNTLTSVQIADDLDLGSASVSGRLDVYRTTAGTPGVSIVGSSSSISTYGTDGQEQIRLHGTSWGEILLHNSLANNATAVNLTAQGSSGGQLTLNNTNGSARALLEGENTGGALTLYQTDGQTGVFLDGDSGGAGLVSVRGTNGGTRATLDGSDGGGGAVRLYENDGTQTVSLTSEGNGNLVLRQGDGTSGLGMFANNGTGGGGMSIYRDDGTFAGQLTVADTTRRDGFLGLTKGNGNWGVVARGQNSATGGGAIYLYDGAGAATVVIDSDLGTEARVSVSGTVRGQVIEITGGSDLSEKFDIQGEALEPGMIVCIDPKNPGQLALAAAAHDKKVAGIVSGAGGVKPGMLMGQHGSVADGKHPVALTGRVYCWVDADANGAIEPGDMLTTSATPGHGMKVTDHTRAVGAIVGKAMTSLEKGKGLVLVLVNLQ